MNLNKNVTGFKSPSDKPSQNQENGAKLFKQKILQKRKTVLILWSCYLIVALFCLIFKPFSQENLLGGLGVGFLTLFAFSGFMWNMTERQYYSLPGTGSPSQHRCVLCGNKGIYRSTIYKTNTVRHICSKCRTELFRRY